MRVTLCENMRAVPYVPFYLALAGGYWESEGLDIRHVVSPSTARTATSLLDGSVDVSWGGPMRVMMHHDADPRCPLVCFGQVVARDPFLLVGRTRKPNFRWRDLAGLRVAPAGDVPTPWMTFQDDLQRAGLDPAAIAGKRVRPMARNLEAFRRGAVDVVQVFEPYADRLVSEGRGHVWHRFSERGDCAYTTFYATRRNAWRLRAMGRTRRPAISAGSRPARCRSSWNVIHGVGTSPAGATRRPARSRQRNAGLRVRPMSRKGSRATTCPKHTSGQRGSAS